MSKTYKSISIVFIITICIKVIDVAKNLIIASKIGVSNDADVFSALIFIPDSILVLVGIDSLRGVVNSEYSALYSKGNINEISESFNNLFKLIFFISLPLLTLIILFNDEVISVMLPGFTGMKKEIALSLSYFILPIFLFKAVGGLIQSLYNSTKSFFMPVILTSLISISMIVSIFLPYYKGNIIFNLAVSNLIGNMLVVSFMFLNFKKFNIRLQFKLPEFDAITKKIFKSCGSITILVLFNQIFLSSRNFFSSYYGEGAISSLTYSSAITAFITTLTFNSVFSVLLSNLSSYHSENNIEGMKVLFSKTIEIILFIFIPISFLFLLFDVNIIKIFYFRGNFDYNAIFKVVAPFYWDSLSIISWITYIIPTAFFLAIKEYKILTVLGSISYIIGILLNYFLTNIYGYYGVAIAAFFTTLLYGVLLMYKSSTILHNLNGMFINIFKITLCGLISLALVFYLKRYLSFFISQNDSVLYLITGSTVFLSVYFILTLSLKVNYLKNIRQSVNL